VTGGQTTGKEKAVEIRVDRDRCVVSGLCVLLVPGVFDQSEEDGKVLLTTGAPGTELAGAVRAAASRCPSGAIRTFGEARETGP
jgi:ferredoxin